MAWSTEQIFLGAAVLLLLSLFASKLSGRLGIPVLLLFLIIGMLAGSDGLGGIYFDNPHIAKTISVAALIFILFSGAVDTNWQDVKQVTWSSISLSTIAVIITAVVMGIAAYYILHFSWLESLLLGTIVSSTDVAAVFTILRSKSIQINQRIKAVIEVESASNDPMAILLTLALIQVMTSPNHSILSLLGLFFLQIIIGSLAGWGMGKAIPKIINYIRLEFTGLYPVLMIALILLLYSLTTVLQGNGFLAVYIAGLLVGQEEFLHKKELLQFYDGLTWLMQIIMFITLGLLVFPSQLVSVLWIDLAIAMILIFIARPIAVFLSLSLSQFKVKEKIMISWIGLRGAVPIILAIFPLTVGIEKGNSIFNLVFFIVLTSILLQGTAIPIVAKWLNLED